MRGALRVNDNAVLTRAMSEGEECIPFICTHDIPAEKGDTPRGRFMRSAIADLDANLRRMGSALILIDGDPAVEIPRAAVEMAAEAVYVAEPDDPVERRRDAALLRALSAAGCRLISVADSVLFGKEEILSGAGTPYTVFTPFMKAWLRRIEDVPPPYPAIVRPISIRIPRTRTSVQTYTPGVRREGETAARERLGEFIRTGIAGYGTLRDMPASGGTSRLSAHLARGTISIRTVFSAAREARDTGVTDAAREGADRFIGELIWREFYHQILGHFPGVTEGPFREEFARVRWSGRKSLFDAWCEGRTGYPIVDAGMRQLNEEGWIHNRIRMVAASFLTKDLHIDWRRGERYFFDRLIDADTASNNGGWQWTAGTGTDASPFFRIFNPVSQGKRFDRTGEYVRRYVPELSRLPASFIHAPWEMSPSLAREISFRAGRDYPAPVVDHAVERGVALSLYRGVRKHGSAPGPGGNPVIAPPREKPA